MIDSITPLLVSLPLNICGRDFLKGASDLKEGNVASEVKDILYEEHGSQRGKEERRSWNLSYAVVFQAPRH